MRSWGGAQTGAKGSNSRTWARINRTYESASGGTLSISEEVRSSGLSATEKAGRQVLLVDTTAYRADDAGSLILVRGNIVIKITADKLSLDEVIRIAESMQLPSS